MTPPQSPEGICRAEVIIRNLAVEEEILRRRPMTTVIYISRNPEQIGLSTWKFGIPVSPPDLE